MNYLLVRFTDILMFVVSILVEDIRWLRGYLRTLTNIECLLFFLLLIVYTLLMKYLIVMIRFALEVCVTYLRKVKPDLISTDMEHKVRLDNLYYCKGYDAGYQAGRDKYQAEEKERKRKEAEERRRKQAEERRKQEEKLKAMREENKAMMDKIEKLEKPWYKKIMPWNW